MVYEGKMKLPEIVEWVKPFALSEAKKRAERNIGGKSQKFTKSKQWQTHKIIDDMVEFDKQIL